jgi:formate dehydrogenase major subunit
MGASTCVACGECVQACPTGALAPAAARRCRARQAASIRVCPYCGVGCQLTYHVKDDRILGRRPPRPGQPGPAVREGALRLRLRAPPAAPDGAADPPRRCAQGRPTPASTPTIGRWSCSARPAGTRRWPSPAVRCAPSATHTAARRWPVSARPRAATKRPTCSRSWCALGFGSNNVDHCTRLCHASSVAALLEGIGSGAVSNPVMDVTQRRGGDRHRRQPDGEPPGGGQLDQERGAPGHEADRDGPAPWRPGAHATHFLQFKPDTDVPLLNAMMHVIVEEGLVDPAFIAERTEGYEALAANVKAYSPERDGARSPASPPTPCARWRGCTPAPRAR